MRARDLYRRSPYILCYWQGKQLVFENYATSTRVAAAPFTCEILEIFDRWRPAEALVRHFPHFTSISLASALLDLIKAGLLERRSDPVNRKAEALTSWKNWSPAACFFHMTTKDSHAPVEPEDSIRKLRRRAREERMPSPLKDYRSNQQIRLPAFQTEGEFPHVLLNRRTWRQFSRGTLKINELATLLGLTFGVQSWVQMRGIGRVALKTSPSGGARHPIEAYVVVQRVQGLSRGLYHYNAANHHLELLHKGGTSSRTSSYLNGQWCFSRVSVVVLMTAVFERVQWKYPASRAYRAVLIDAGHLCQTFCLVATWLGLAPFCTMALSDSRIENDLGIDGITESVIYSAGVGKKLKGIDWAPWPSRAYGHRIENPFM